MANSFKIAAAAALSVILAVSCNQPAPTEIDGNPVTQVDASKTLQTVEGWGVSLCWWAHMCGVWPDEDIDKLLDWVVSPDGLNYNLFRYNIGGGDDPENRNCTLHHMARGKGIRAEMPGFKMYEDSEYDWEADSAQVKIMLKIREKRPDAQFEAFSNSAPWWMTISGCVAGNANPGEDNLKKEYYEAFADYLVDVCEHMKEAYGIEFRTLEPFNEAMSRYWGQNGGQEGCHFDAESQAEFIPILYKRLSQTDLKTVISASDETSVAQSRRALATYGDALQYVKQWNVHTYTVTDEDRAALRDEVKAKGLPLWMSETGAGGRGINGNIALMQRMFDDMNIMQPAAWIDWQTVGGDTQWSTVMSRNFDAGDYAKTKSFPVHQQVTCFIKVGYKILETSAKDVLAAISPDGKEIVVATLNNGKEAKTFNFSFANAKVKNDVAVYTTSETQDLEASQMKLEDKILSAVLEPQTMKTFVIAAR